MAYVESNRRKVDMDFDRAAKMALRIVGGKAEKDAKESISDMGAVDTGLLRNSITFALGDDYANTTKYHSENGSKIGKYSGTAPKNEDGEMSVWIGTNVYYAPYVHEGTSKMDARPFLSSSILRNYHSYMERFKEVFSRFF